MTHFGSYNIIYGLNGGLELAMHVMDQDNTDLGTLQETKVSGSVYTRALTGFCVVEMDTPSRHHGGITIFYRDLHNFAAQVLQLHGRNVIRFQTATGDCNWNIVGCYLELHNASTLERFVAAIGQRPWGVNLLVAGNFNTYLADLDGK